jgi:pimeloyl-ACP methyl ester carboxylesterase
MKMNYPDTHTTGRDLNIKLNGLTVCYDDLGDGEIPIIFIHGFPFDKTTWHSQLEFFKKTHRVIAYDIRGFGKSTPGKEKASIALFADDLLSFMDALKIKKATVCGFSMGGYILLNAVDKDPERFKSIILSDTQCAADTVETIKKREQTIRDINAGKINDFTEAFVSNVFCAETQATKKDVVDDVRAIILSTAPLSIIAGLTAMAERKEMCSTLNKISIPTLIMCGKQDVVTALPQSEFLKNNIQGSKLHIIDFAGHMTNLEQPDDFNKHLAEFVSITKQKVF